MKTTITMLILMLWIPCIAAPKLSPSLRDDLMAQPGIVDAQFLFIAPPFKSCHASTIEETKDYLVSAYFAGDDEGEKNVGIWISRKRKGTDKWVCFAFLGEWANGWMSV